MKRTQEVRDAHQEHAKKLLDMGLQKADVAATLQRKYSLSRATAYRDVDDADISRESEDHKIEADPMPEITLEDREPLMRMTKHLLIDAYEQGNVQDYARLVREYERLARMGGLSTSSRRLFTPFQSTTPIYEPELLPFALLRSTTSDERQKPVAGVPDAMKLPEPSCLPTSNPP